MAGFLELENANVSWLLSTLLEDVPETDRSQGKRAYRSLAIEGEEINLSENFQSLHTRVYEETLAGRGISLEEVRPSVELIYNLNHQKIAPESGILHPLLRDR
jgi:UDP-N-acetyl-2-amino-2-deoxyglucuronate dehydrogenase